MQHFYNTHIFKSSIESCRDEGIRCEVEVDYVDNVPCIDLVSSLVRIKKKNDEIMNLIEKQL
jgi:dachs protein